MLHASVHSANNSEYISSYIYSFGCIHGINSLVRILQIIVQHYGHDKAMDSLRLRHSSRQTVHVTAHFSEILASEFEIIFIMKANDHFHNECYHDCVLTSGIASGLRQFFS